MKVISLIITDVADLPGEICVAGWCAEERRLLRPRLAASGAVWTEELAGPHLFEMGNVVRLKTAEPAGERGLPFAREDVAVAVVPELVGTLGRYPLLAALRPSESPSVAALFGAALRDGHPQCDGYHVMAGDDCPSLGAVEVRAGAQMSFDDGPRGVVCRFVDASDASYALPVASHPLRRLHAERGAGALNDLAGGHRRAHIRLGALPPDADGRVRIAVTNILFY
ncbi:MAG TPA: hypothetical protein VD995_15535 [Azospirillum sp.]|nr:hypothetical protein [Azospirillum sp.]